MNAFDSGQTDQSPLDQALAERNTLIKLCLYAFDRVKSNGIGDRIEEALASVGVTAVRPDGAHFDPQLHEAGGTIPTPDPALSGVIAETEIVGFIDRGHYLRPPIVTVYTST
jgi:hypothetical protein